MSEEEKEELHFQLFMHKKRQKRNKDASRRAKMINGAGRSSYNGVGADYYYRMVQESIKHIRDIQDHSTIGANGKAIGGGADGS